MTRRLVTAILAVTVAALLLAGVGTLLIARFQARDATEGDLREQVVDLRDSLVSGIGRPGGAGLRGGALVGLRRALSLEGLGVLVFGPRGRTTDELPVGVEPGDLDLDALAAGEVLSGSRGDLVWAAAGQPLASGTVVVAASRSVETGTGQVMGWFLGASIVVVAGAALVAVSLGRRLTRPVRDADRVAEQIAAGDLAARLPEPPANQHDELAQLARSINAMAGTLERSRGLEQQFLLSVSHDLRTPLTSIRGYAEAIADGTAEPRAAAGVILDESRRLERLVRDLLDLARLDARSFTLHPQAIDLADAAEAVALAFGPDAAAAGLEVRTLTATEVPVLVDPDRLAQVVANLVENALKYANSTVSVEVRGDGRHGVLLVDDDGPGIAPDDLPHVFERLYVAERAPRRRESGSGLGLAIVRELVVAMGGEAEALRSPSGGARFVVRLPLATPLPPPSPG